MENIKHGEEREAWIHRGIHRGLMPYHAVDACLSLLAVSVQLYEYFPFRKY